MGDIFLINQSEPRKKKMKDKNFGMAPNNKNIPAILLLSYKPLIKIIKKNINYVVIFLQQLVNNK